MASSRTLPLREWTPRALDSVDVAPLANDSLLSSLGPDPDKWAPDIKRSLALSSSAYLMSALKVARLLAEGVCQIEDGSSPRRLPAPGAEWAELIAVHLSNIDRCVDAYEWGLRENGSDLQPLPFSPENSASDPKALQGMLNSLFPDQSVYEEKDEAADGEAGEGGPVTPHDVVRVEIVPGEGETNGQRNPQMVMYALGMAYYELFSGGEKHPDVTPPNVNIAPYNSQAVNEFGEIEPASFDAAPLVQTGGLDLAGTLNILDDIPDQVDTGAELAEALNLFNDGPEDLPEENLNRSKRGKAAQRSSISYRSVSVEALKLKGLPMALCDLVENMLDCVNGILSGKEAYQSMSDVRDDLQLMLDRPHKFLHDIDCQTLSVAGLPLTETTFGREREFAMLQDAYRRSIAGERQLAIVSGPAGIGKSVLARRLGDFVAMQGGQFLVGKFDKLQSATPFSALTAAFNQYCDELMADEGRSGRLQEVAARLRGDLSEEERAVLAPVIPRLSALIGQEGGGPVVVDAGCVDAEKRLQYLLRRFVDIISSGEPITLFLDDLQWSDPASMSAINQILLGSGSPNGDRQFFFLGSCRVEAFGDHPFGHTLLKLRHLGLNATVVALDCMDKEMTNAMVSELLCLSPRLTRTLSEVIYFKSKGSPLYFSQLMMSLHKDKLLRLSLSRKRWEWDEEKISSRKLPDDVAAFMSSTIEKLDEDVQMALSLLSCFGASLSIVIIEALELKLGLSLVDSLEKAVAEGVVDKVQGSYCFSHDILQSASYALTKPEETCLYHFKYGVTLVSCSLEVDDNEMLFIAAGQLNLGGPKAVEDKDQSVLIANLNLNAGQKAMEMSNYSAAYDYFDHGTSFLRKGHWQEHYQLSLSLFENATKCALFNGNIVGLRMLADMVMRNAKCFEDKLEVLYTTVSALASASEVAESVKVSVGVLSQLGEELPQCSTDGDTILYIEQTKGLLQGLTDEQLVGYRTMDDSMKKAAMKFYARTELSYQMINPSLQPLVTAKMVQLSLAHGLSVHSPIGFTHFGALVAKLGDIEEGCRYVTIARKMMDRMSSEVAGEVIATGTQILCFKEPVQATVERHINEGYTMAMSAGDTHGATLNSGLHLGSLFWAGVKLNVCLDVTSRACREMEEHNQLTWLSHCTELKKVMELLTGAREKTDEGGDRESQEANPHAAYFVNLQKMVASFIFRDYPQTLVYALNLFDVGQLHKWSLLYLHTGHSFYKGLAAWWIFRTCRDPIWQERGRRSLAEMKKWAESSQHNFSAQAYLLEAEEAFSNNLAERAESLYEMAISSAKEHRFPNVQALASELAGLFLLECDKKDRALEHFMAAHELYHDWGAIAKSNALFQYVQSVLGPGASAPVHSLSSSSHSNGHSNSKGRGKRTSEASD